MKKILLIAMSVAMLFTFAACGTSGKDFDSMTAYEHYVAATEKLNKAKSLEMEMTGDVKISMEASGQKVDLDMTMDGVIKQIIRSQTDSDFTVDMEMGLMGQSANVSITYIDGIMYMDDSMSKTKQTVDAETMLEQAGVSGAATSVEFLEDAVSEQTMEDVENGKKITFTIDPAKASEIVEQYTGQTTKQLEGLNADVKLDVTSITYEMTIDREHNLKDMRVIMVLGMEMVIEGQTATALCDIDMGYSIAGIDNVDAITAPADADSYVEATPAA